MKLTSEPPDKRSTTASVWAMNSVSERESSASPKKLTRLLQHQAQATRHQQQFHPPD